MTIFFGEFITMLSKTPSLQMITLLTIGVMLVNGWTDAPNAIASLVASGGMELKKAVRMAAFLNFAGLALMTACNSTVACTIYHIADFGDSPQKALTALCAALLAIIVWAAAAWSFGIPTSESHALIAGLTGASISIHNGLAGIHGVEWMKVIYGLFFSSFLGFGLGWAGGKMLFLKGKKAYGACQSRRWKKYKSRAEQMQIAGAAAMAFMHGAQDGQKFIGVFLMGIFLAKEEMPAGHFYIPFWMTIWCSIVIASGTAIGGDRIIKTVGVDMVKLRRSQGIVSDAAAAICLLFFSLIGFPVSTTHVKTTAIMGVGIASDAKTVNISIIKEMIFAWLITFPGCCAIGYCVTEIFQKIIH